MKRRKRDFGSAAPPLPEDGITRRDLLKGALGLGAMAALSGCASADKSGPARPASGAPRFSAARPGLIRHENSLPGTRDWLLAKTRVDPQTKYRCPWIEGYCSRTSVRAGESISFHVSTDPPSPFTIDFYRMGYYGGAGGREVLRLGPFPGGVQPDPPVGENRLRDCQWEPCAQLTIPRDWVSGVYLGKLTSEREGWQSYLIFIVRDDGRASSSNVPTRPGRPTIAGPASSPFTTTARSSGTGGREWMSASTGLMANTA